MVDISYALKTLGHSGSNDSLGRTKFPVPNGFTSQEVSQFLKKYDLSTYHIPKLKNLEENTKKTT
jgi:hypothetical protein